MAESVATEPCEIRNNYTRCAEAQETTLDTLSKSIFGEIIPPLEVEFVNAFEYTHPVAGDTSINIERIAWTIASRSPNSMRVINPELDKIYDAVYGVIDDNTKDYLAQTIEEKRKFDVLLQEIRETPLETIRRSIEVKNNAGVVSTHHQSFELTVEEWTQRAASDLKDTIINDVLRRSTREVEKSRLPIWKQLLENQGLKETEEKFKSSSIMKRSNETNPQGNDLPIEVHLKENAGVGESGIFAGTTRLSIVVTHLACCALEKARNYAYSTRANTFKPAEEIINNGNPLLEAPETSQSDSGFLSPRSLTGYSVVSQRSNCSNPDNVIPFPGPDADLNDWELGWHRDIRHNIYKKALCEGTISVPGVATWLPGRCYTFFRTGGCGHGESCRFKHEDPIGLNLKERIVPICPHHNTQKNRCWIAQCRMLHMSITEVEELQAAARTDESPSATASAKRRRVEDGEATGGKRLNEFGGQ